MLYGEGWVDLNSAPFFHTLMLQVSLKRNLILPSPLCVFFFLLAIAFFFWPPPPLLCFFFFWLFFFLLLPLFLTFQLRLSSSSLCHVCLFLFNLWYAIMSVLVYSACIVLVMGLAKENFVGVHAGHGLLVVIPIIHRTHRPWLRPAHTAAGRIMPPALWVP